jgi:hypothetical protein
MNIALALVMGLLAAALVFFAFGTPTGTADPQVIGAIVAFIVVFAVSYYFIEELLGLVTAIIGGILVAIGMYIVRGIGSGLVSGLVGLGVFLVGLTVQEMKVRRQKRAKAVMANPQAYVPPPPPPAPK